MRRLVACAAVLCAAAPATADVLESALGQPLTQITPSQIQTAALAATPASAAGAVTTTSPSPRARSVPVTAREGRKGRVVAASVDKVRTAKSPPKEGEDDESPSRQGSLERREPMDAHPAEGKRIVCEVGAVGGRDDIQCGAERPEGAGVEGAEAKEPDAPAENITGEVWGTKPS